MSVRLVLTDAERVPGDLDAVEWFAGEIRKAVAKIAQENPRGNRARIIVTIRADTDDSPMTSGNTLPSLTPDTGKR